MNLGIVLTGDRPTGPLHLGHYKGSLKNRLNIQSKIGTEFDKQLIMIADLQAYTDNYDNVQKITSNIENVVLDYLSIGIDPKKTIIFRQSKIRSIAELYFYFMNFVTFDALKHNPTVKTEIALKNKILPASFLSYPVHQAADIAIFKSTHVPVGEDQKPMIELTNNLVRKFNNTYQTSILKEVKGIISDTPRLTGIDGKNKASKSLNNAIFLSENSKSLKEKVYSMYTDPNHIKISDPGSIQGNTVFEYLTAFHEDQKYVDELKLQYQKGGLGDIKVKNILYQTLENFITPISNRRKQLENNIDVNEILSHGANQANEIAEQTISEIKQVTGL